MDDGAKKTALRMIPYGIYVMTAEGDNGAIAAATVNWVTQTSFDPPLLAIGVKADSTIYDLAKTTGRFTLNMLGKGQQGAAFAFFKPAERDGDTLSGEPIRASKKGALILENAIASVDCQLAEIVARGDHHIMVGEVVDANVASEPEARPDDAILAMRDLGDKVFYGG